METSLVVWVVVGLVAVAIVASLAFAAASRRRSASLRARFGPEYDRAVDQLGRAKGEHLLADRLQRVHHMRFRALYRALFADLRQPDPVEAGALRPSHA